MLDGYVCIDGQLCAAAEARVSVFDRGFLYGDSAFEVMRVYGGKPFCEREHLDRLSGSCERILIPAMDQAGWSRDIHRTLQAAGWSDAYVRIMVTRGVGPMGLDIAGAGSPSVIVMVMPLHTPPQTAYDDGIAVGLSRAARATDGTAAVGAKTSNYLGAVLALHEVKQRGAAEALVVGPGGEVVEGATSNVFLVRGGVLVTPPLAAGILAGITRKLIIEIAKELGISVREEQVYPTDLYAADEVFITSTIRELLPVVRVDDVRVADGRPGPLAQRLLQAYRARARAAG